MLEEGRSFLNTFVALKNLPVDKIWLSPEEARQFVGLKSRNSIKDPRENGVIHYAKIGREFYDRKSLEDYIVSKSSKRYSLNPVKCKR